MRWTVRAGMALAILLMAGWSAAELTTPVGSPSEALTIAHGPRLEPSRFTLRELWRSGELGAGPELEFAGPYLVTAFGPNGVVSVLDQTLGLGELGDFLRRAGYWPFIIVFFGISRLGFWDLVSSVSAGPS